MVRVRSIEIGGIRGIRAPITLRLTDGNGKKVVNTLVFGRNGAGKSSITDAWEWFCWGTVEHLQREGAGLAAMPHRGSVEPGYIEVEFDDVNAKDVPKRLTARRAIDPGAPNANTERRISPDGAKHPDLVKNWLERPTHLRFADMARFVALTKTERYDELADWMMLRDQVLAQTAMASVRRRLRAESEERSAAMELAQNRVADAVGGAGSGREPVGEICFGLAGDLAPFGLHAGESLADLAHLEQLLRARVDGAASARALGAVQRTARRLVDQGCSEAVDTVLAALSRHRKRVESFAKREATTKDLLLARLYESGLRVIDGDDSVAACPLCEQPVTPGLEGRVRVRADELLELQRARDAAGRTREEVVDSLSHLLAVLRGAERALEQEEATVADAEVKGGVRGLSKAIRDEAEWVASMPERVRQGDVNPVAEERACSEWKARLEQVSASLKAACADFGGHAGTLHESVGLHEPEEGSALRAYEKVRDVHAALRVREDAAAAHERLERVFRAFENEADAYAEACAADVLGRFQAIEADVATYFQILEKHTPDVGRTRLCVRQDGERSLILEIEFAEETSPAHRYLSESQLNSFGLAVFLASAKHLNPEFDFLLLDDVVNSLDAYKRPRLLELLEEHFQGKQILLLTHDDVWAARVQRDTRGWACRRFRRNRTGLGPTLEDAGTTLEDLRRLLDEDGDANVAGIKLAVLMEDKLQGWCERFGASLRFNRRNEHTLGPLLEAFQERCVKKVGAGGALGKAVAAVRSNLGFRNLCAHAKNVSSTITIEEVRDALDAWSVLDGMIRCPKASCRKAVSWLGEQRAFFCACGARFPSGSSGEGAGPSPDAEVRKRHTEAAG